MANSYIVICYNIIKKQRMLSSCLMGKIMHKRILTVGILFLLMLSINIPISPGNDITIPFDGGDILYVGGSGSNNYTKIQDAINDSSNLDTVFVYDDSSPYYENLIINKSISLIGENKETTVIDGSGNKIIILIRLCDNVKIQGFTIKNSSRSKINWDYATGIGIQLLAATFCIISDMIITNTDIGIYLLNYIWDEFTYSNTLSQNIFIKNKYGVALDWGSGYTTIVNNVFRLNWYGIIIITTNYNTIMKNNFLWNFRSVLLRPDVIWPDGDPLDEINHNKWSMNYWGRPQYLHLILGRARVVYDHASWYVRYTEVDWNPVKEPYDIGVQNE